MFRQGHQAEMDGDASSRGGLSDPVDWAGADSRQAPCEHGVGYLCVADASAGPEVLVG